MNSRSVSSKFRTKEYDAELLEELSSIRQELLEKIEEATLLFSSKTDDPEFTTGKAALRNLEEWIERIKEKDFCQK